jgi:uncharacterized membrane protein YoaK (UPF0700 family)
VNDQALPITTREAGALSFIAGYVDTCIFIALFGLFTAHVTGNLVLIGSELVHRAPGDVFPKLLAFAAFVLAVVVAVLLDRRVEARSRVPVFLAIEGALLVLALLAAGPREPTDAGTLSAILAGSFGAAAMGFQNAMMRLRLPELPSTTVMTMNVTQAVIDSATLSLPANDAARGEAREKARVRLRRMGPQIGWFTLGAAAGAAGFELAKMLALALPALLCGVLAWRVARAS